MSSAISHVHTSGPVLSAPGKLPSSHVIKDSTSGYTSTPFPGKETQLDAGMYSCVLLISLLPIMILTHFSHG